MIWIVQRKRRGLSCKERDSVLNHFDIASVCIYLAWEEAQWDFYAVYPVRFVVRTCLAPEIFITGIVSQSFSASAPGTIMHAKQIKALPNQWGRNLFTATKHRTTKYSQHSKAGTQYWFPFWKKSNCVKKPNAFLTQLYNYGLVWHLEITESKK